MRALLAFSLALSTLVAGCERPPAHSSVATAPATSAVPAPLPPVVAPTDASKPPDRLAADPGRSEASAASLRREELRRRTDAKRRGRSGGDVELCPGLAGQNLDDCLALEERRLGGASARGEDQALRDFREQQAQRDRELFEQDANSGYGRDPNTDPGWNPRQAQLPPPGYDLPPQYNELPPDYNDPPPDYTDLPPDYSDGDDLPPDEQFIP